MVARLYLAVYNTPRRCTLDRFLEPLLRASEAGGQEDSGEGPHVHKVSCPP